MKNREFWDKSGKLLLALALVIGIVSLSMNLITLFMEKQRAAASYSAYPQKPKEEEVSVINVLAAGSVDIRDGYRDTYISAFEDMRPVFANYDISAFNMIPLVGSDVPAAFADTLVNAGLDTVSLANPRSLALGKAGVDASLDYWQNVSAALNTEVISAGTYRATDEQNKLNVAEKNGIRTVFLSYTDVLEDELPEHEKYLVNVYDDVKSPETVAKAAEQADVVIVSVSWDGTDGEMPNDRQREIAETLADAGASVILGNAEDAVQPVCWIDDTLVCYSLGSLFSDDPEAAGVIAAVTITRTVSGEMSRVELTNPRVDVVRTAFAEDGAKIYAMEGRDLSDEEKDVYAHYTGILQRMDDSIRIGGLQ